VIVLIEDRDGFRCTLEQGGEVHILFLERVVESFPIGDVDRDSNRSRDVAVGAAKRLDARLEGPAFPIHLVAYQLTLQRPQMRGERCEPRIPALQHFVKRHPDLIAAGSPDQIEARSL
jgi:hypothetical protein